MPTIQAVIDHILSEVPGAPFAETVDVVVAGDPAWEVTGIVTTFLATRKVLQQAIAVGANLIVSHETSFYNHYNRTDWLADNTVYLAKKRLTDEFGLAIWRLHDTWHRRQPDGILIGVLRALEWTAYSNSAAPILIELPPRGWLISPRISNSGLAANGCSCWVMRIRCAARLRCSSGRKALSGISRR